MWVNRHSAQAAAPGFKLALHAFWQSIDKTFDENPQFSDFVHSFAVNLSVLLRH